ncbi:helix-turn-helix domain-containing protein [Natronolimnohabitans sp. A-GB9]|uniref:TrmB family transcriptional regulator n=1 Tax=Natronolimnohabitans sp. A-GB9 TaxID=3069757 RepID=UPI0027AE0858|nr:helix-turn-helix domain-containing protein [Natronolimnohabitans sp. A-GB9]MDQ2049347.1 helix-turn-helix domain-containing protein [Natronolimnohabitans sp. A-GB9]
MNTSASDALEAFERLGLTSYEAKVFIALQRLGSGTARDVSDVVDVPRSQVYSVAENLAERGLIEVQQSSPIRYRPVSVDEARQLLRKDFETEQDRAFTYVESVREEAKADDEQESVWTVRGRERVTERLRSLVSEADQRIVVAISNPELIDDESVSLLEGRAADGITVRVLTDSDDVGARFDSCDGIDVTVQRRQFVADDSWGRLIVVDTDTILLSVVDAGTETAIWSSQSPLASILVELATSRIERSTVVA